MVLAIDGYRLQLNWSAILTDCLHEVGWDSKVSDPMVHGTLCIALV